VASSRRQGRAGSADSRPTGSADAVRHPADTRGRILRIALELFSAQGYAGTSITDIAGRLGTATSALYYHFRSKADILQTLLAEPIAAYTALAELAAANPPARELLGAYLDMTASSRELLSLVSADPGIRALLDERLPVKPADMIEGIITTLAGPGPDHRALIRAHAAFAVVKEGTSTCLTLTGSVTPQDKTDILDAALRVLSPGIGFPSSAA
jgi:AcrR family transcriptional regulator